MAGVTESTCDVGVRAGYEGRGDLVAVVDVVSNITTHTIHRNGPLESRILRQEHLSNRVSRGSAPCLQAQGITRQLHANRHAVRRLIEKFDEHPVQFTIRADTSATSTASASASRIVTRGCVGKLTKCRAAASARGHEPTS